MGIIFVALRWFYNIVVMLILIRVFCSWFVRNPYQTKWYMLVVQITEPILAPCRNLMSRFRLGGMMVDFSPVIALILLSLIYRVLYAILRIIIY